MKRFLPLLILLLLPALPVRADASMPGTDGSFSVQAKAACLIDAASGRVLYAQNADTPLPMASTTKIMTCLLALENADPADIVTAGRNAAGVEGTSIYLSEGEALSLRDLLYGLMLRSGNDAAVAIAEHIAGSADEFALLMDRRAAELGADASFRNPHGLPAEGHAASARAMTLIAREALRIPLFRQIVSTRRATIPWSGSDFARVLTNKNKLLTTYDGASGVKTGFTKAAGRCLVFSAERGGMELIGCVLNCPDWFGEAARLLDLGFERYHPVTVLAAGEPIAQIPVTGARQTVLSLCAAQPVQLALRDDEQTDIRIHTQSAAAPIAPGDILGSAEILIGNEPFCEIPLIACAEVPEWGLLPALRRLWERYLLISPQ